MNDPNSKGGGKGGPGPARVVAAGGKGRGKKEEREGPASESSRLLQRGDSKRGGALRVSPVHVNPLEASVREANSGLGFVLFMWCIGLGCVGIRIYEMFGVSYSYWIVMCPLWLGDIVGVVAGCLALSRAFSLRFLTAEQRASMRLFQASTGTAAAVSGTVRGESVRPGVVAVDMEYLPLVQRFVLAALAGLSLVLMATATQILFCIHLEHAPLLGYEFGPMTCIIPLIVVVSFALLHVVLIRSEGIISFTFWLLLLAGSILVALKTGNHPLVDEVQWDIILVPFWAIDALFGLVILWVGLKYVLGSYSLAPQQLSCLGLYLLALLALTEGQISLLYAPEEPTYEGRGLLAWTFTKVGGAFALWLSCSLFFLSVYYSAEFQATELLATLVSPTLHFGWVVACLSNP
jgi:hypothetical protein